MTGWPAWKTWSFTYFADVALAAGAASARFQNGLVEQGATNPPIDLHIAPYALALEAAATSPHDPDSGLCSDQRLSALHPDEEFRLDWSYLASFVPNRVYLAQWEFLSEFPSLRDDMKLDSLWQWRSNWPSLWMGPAGTVTGLHRDYPDNWFCQFRGEKEFVLFPPENELFMSVSGKYDPGSVLSRTDIMLLHQESLEAKRLSHARGLYARVQPGDALFVPRDTWHCVVAREPSISLSVFGLTPLERLTGGLKDSVLDGLHRVGLYRRGNCTCHEAGVAASRER